MLRRLSIAILLASLTHAAQASERTYQAVWCAQVGGTAEYVLPDRTRVDCLTDTHAVEVEHAKKWAQAVGQSLHYAAWTGRRAAVLLIVSDGEERFLKRLQGVVNHYGLPIDIFVVRP